jgi:hypothetical protein
MLGWRGAIDAAWEKDAWTMSTQVPLTVTGSRSRITTLLCTLPVSLGWRTKSFPVRKGPNPRNNLEDKPRAVRFALTHAL